MSKDDGIVKEIVGALKFAIRNRKGIKIPCKIGLKKKDGEKIPSPYIETKTINEVKLGKLTINIDNKIPGLILDTFDNLGYITKDERKPELMKKMSKRTDYGWQLYFNLPPSITYKKVKSDEDAFSDAVKGSVFIKKVNGLVFMDIYTSTIPNLINFEWNPQPYLEQGMILPFPVGMGRDGLIVHDLATSPHLLVAGVTNFGKTSLDRVLIHSLLPLGHVRMAIIDKKRVDFPYLKDHVLMAEDEPTAIKLLQWIRKEQDRRTDILIEANVEKIQEYEGAEDLPYIVCIIEEFATIESKEIHKLIKEISMLGRFVGIHLVAGTQKPSAKAMDTDTRSQFLTRICYVVSNESDSRMILGESNSEAAWLEAIPGRCIFKHGIEIKEAQTMWLSRKKAEKMVKGLSGRGWSNLATNNSRKRIKPN